MMTSAQELFSGQPLPTWRNAAEPMLDDVWLAGPRTVEKIMLAAGNAAAPVKPSAPHPTAKLAGSIKIVHVNGVMAKYPQWWMSWLGGTSTLRALREIDEAAADASVGAILLHVDSPGGQVAGTDDLALSVRNANARKPVVAFLEDMAASAAYYVASQAGRIVANESAVIGSLGVLTVLSDTSMALSRAGIRIFVIGSAPLKALGGPGAEVTEEHLVELRALVDRSARLFLDRVASGRRLPYDQARALFDGRVWGAQEAKRLRLIDEVGTLDGVVQELVQQTRPPRLTLGALRAAFPGADVDFLSRCVRDGLSIQEAQAAWAEQKPPVRHRSRWERSNYGVLS